MRGVGATTGCGEVFLTISALATSSAETVDHSLPDAEIADGGTDRFDKADKLMAKEVTLL